MEMFGIISTQIDWHNTQTKLLRDVGFKMRWAYPKGRIENLNAALNAVKKVQQASDFIFSLTEGLSLNPEQFKANKEVNESVNNITKTMSDIILKQIAEAKNNNL